ncbi:hypothetical protein L3X38_000347 [Prunus dulcis]|uniref:Uncharacterized protein n=1 Tax=Prunus dulcis TaxID=3755 RepID=A0AAD4UPV4_PRUDU|nr:hypothetical protein L3X38_000347 [Prunus dulcis]
MVSSIEAGGSWTNVRRDQNLDDEHSKRATPSPPKLFPDEGSATAPPCSSVGPPLSALILSHPGINSAVARYCPLWAPLSALTGFVFWELTSNFSVGHSSWDCSSPQLA